jgi:hypothetical protein
MKEIWTGIQAGFTAMGGFLGWVLGGMDGFIHALMGLSKKW